MCKIDDEKWGDIGCFIIICGLVIMMISVPVSVYFSEKSKIQERNFYVERGYEQKNDNGKIVWIKSERENKVNVSPE